MSLNMNLQSILNFIIKSQICGIHKLLNYGVAPWEVADVHCLVWPKRPILDLQSLLHPLHVKTDAWCGFWWSCWCLAVLLACLFIIFFLEGSLPSFQYLWHLLFSQGSVICKGFPWISVNVACFHVTLTYILVA